MSILDLRSMSPRLILVGDVAQVGVWRRVKAAHPRW
jgi:hypothetical protein